MPAPMTVVDAFTQAPFRGNPAAVCFPAAGAADPWMQAVAGEMNLAETAFLRPAGAAWDLRWFTPTVEVDLCGHATLAAAHVLWESGRLARSEPARFNTRSGLLTATREEGWIVLDFPSDPLIPAAPPEGLIEALGVQPLSVLRGRFDLVVEVTDEETVRTLAPDLSLLAGIDVRGVAITSQGSPPYDLVSRFFAPRYGIPEDPVTGSVHCALVPFWAARLRRSSLLAFQASRRGGVLRCETAGQRVRLAGQAVTVLEGELLA
jgi:PhzF family phenazine biosynthesis protein